MAISKILPTDRLQSGFRTRYNATVDEIWVSISDKGNGSFEITKFNGQKISFNLQESFYTKAEIADLLSGNDPASESTAGIVQIATLQEVNEGEDDGKVITPYKANISSLFPFKGIWKPDFNEQNTPQESGYMAGMLVVFNGIIWISDVDYNISEPGSNANWTKIGGGGLDTVTFNQANLVSMGDGFYKLPISLDSDKAVIAIKIVPSSGTPYQKPVEYDDGFLINFDNNSNQTIYVKIG